MEVGWKLAVTPLGNPFTDKAAAPVKPFEVEIDTANAKDWPGIRLTDAGVTPKVKPEDVVTVRLLTEVAVLAPTITSIGPVAAPAGITNDKLAAVNADTGAFIEPPPCWASITWGVAAFSPIKLAPVTVMIVPATPDAGENPVMAGAGGVPVPEIETNCGELLAFPVTLTTAVRSPETAGVKCPWIKQLAPAARLDPQLFANTKDEAPAPVKAMLEMANGDPPVLVKVTCCDALVTPTVSLPNDKLVADKDIVVGR